MYSVVIEGKGGIYAKVVADSVANNVRLTTLELNYHRFIHSEFMTHRMFSRNASSSRAIPVDKVIEQVRSNPAIPIHWGKNKSGMQANEECNNLIPYDSVDEINLVATRERWWEIASLSAAGHSEQYNIAGYHKQIVNRITEPFQFIRVIVTATEWENFFNQRLHPDAQPEIQELARCMKETMDKSTPEILEKDQWHLPYISIDEDLRSNLRNNYGTAIRCSVARCARVSYKNHDRSDPDVKKDLELYNHLKASGHMSPFEHVATPMSPVQMNGLLHGVHPDNWDRGTTHVDKHDIPWSGNLRGWLQWRHLITD